MAITALNNTGVSLLTQGRYEEAEAEFRAALAERPRAPMSHVNLGLALRFQGRDDEARPLFEQALQAPAVRRIAGDLNQALEERDKDFGDFRGRDRGTKES